MPSGRKPGSVQLDIKVEAGDWPPLPTLRKLARQAVDAAAKALNTPGRPQLSLLFTDDAHMRRLNRDWRKADKSTNVLSFPAVEQNQGFPGFLGDIALAFETIEAESKAEALTFEDHLTHLIVHGFLHLHGFNHAKNDEADRMEGLETAILGGLGIKDPYRAPGA